MREITTHKINGCNEAITLTVRDEPGHGGACHEYCLSIPGKPSCVIKFQNGPIKEAGVNGLTLECLLAIAADRLEGFQSGEYANSWNKEALDCVKKALISLKNRTLDRVLRGVEGIHQV